MRGTDFYESYTGVVLPLKKLDFMAIPGKRGAVENWGLIQFDERRLLFNEVCSAAVSDRGGGGGGGWGATTASCGLNSTCRSGMVECCMMRACACWPDGGWGGGGGAVGGCGWVPFAGVLVEHCTIGKMRARLYDRALQVKAVIQNSAMSLVVKFHDRHSACWAGL